ncbi:MAG: DUF2344 domain-containing protein [Elusimicrobia bacterium]|nr:DUF2344 domain-containing protein [Elusimicrobiota bacterium]
MSIADAVARRSLIERVAAVSQRPSQYAGCEIGSSVKLKGPSPRKNIALCWRETYDRAMSDPMLIAIYGELSGIADFVVERIFSSGDDFEARLRLCGYPGRQFSLETKRPLDEFDAFVVPGPEALAEFKNFKNNVFIIDLKDRATLEPLSVVSALIQNFGVTQTGPRGSGPRCPLIPFRSHEDYRLAEHCLPPQKNHGGFGHQALRLRLARSGWSRFVSHLEQIQVIKSAALLARWPMAASRGRHGRLRMSFGPAISVGWESQAEYADIFLNEAMDIEAALERLREFLPAGYEIVSLKRIPWHFPSLEESANVAEYWIEARDDRAAPDWERLLHWIENVRERRGSPVVVRKEKPGQKVDLIDAADVLISASVGLSPLEGQGLVSKTLGLRLTMRYGPKKNLKPEKILELGLGLPMDSIATDIRICRRQLLLETSPERWRPLS